MKSYLHHGVMFSYYSAKTRSYLSYKRIPFVEVYSGGELADGPDGEPGRLRKVIHKGMIPVVETPEGDILQDTTAIIDELEQRHPERPVMPKDPVLLLLSRIVEFVVDEFWISTSMHSRWNDPESNAFATRDFGNRIGRSLGLEGPAAQKMGKRVAGKMQSYLPGIGIGDADGQRAASEYFEAASLALDAAVSPTGYAFGSYPCLMDFCLFTAYYAHQYRDLGDAQTFLKRETPNLAYFLDNLHAAQCAPDAEGDLDLSEEFLSYLEVFCPPGAAFAASILEASSALAEDAAVGEPFEQRLAPFTIDLQGHSFTRGGSTFSAWKLQRARDVYRSLDPADLARADAIVERIGWSNILEAEPSFRLERRDYRTCLA